MAMSVLMQKVHDLAMLYDKNLRAENFDPYMIVVVRHEDQTLYQFHSAFLMELNDPAYCYGHEDDDDGWVIVFSEHNGTHVFAKGDLGWYGQYRNFDPEPFPLEEVLKLQS